MDLLMTRSICPLSRVLHINTLRNFVDLIVAYSWYFTRDDFQLQLCQVYKPRVALTDREHWDVVCVSIKPTKYLNTFQCMLHYLSFYFRQENITSMHASVHRFNLPGPVCNIQIFFSYNDSNYRDGIIITVCSTLARRHLCIESPPVIHQDN